MDGAVMDMDSDSLVEASSVLGACEAAIFFACVF